jgi:tripartite-type tricarboxylate transporter receptor subunit TctC
VLDKLSAAMAQVLQMPDVKEKLANMALDVATPGPVEMKAKLESDVARWQKLAKELDIKPLE